MTISAGSHAVADESGGIETTSDDVPRFLVYARSADSSKHLMRDLLEHLGCVAVIVPSIGAIFDEGYREQKYNGLIVTVSPKSITEGELATLNQLKSNYPIFFTQKPVEDDLNLISFIQSSMHQPARHIRAYTRVVVTVPVVVKSVGTVPYTLQTSVSDISENGCFVIDPNPDSINKVRGKTVVVDFPTMGLSGIECEVRWIQEWGKDGKFPGYGLQFMGIGSTVAKKIFLHAVAVKSRFRLFYGI